MNVFDFLADYMRKDGDRLALFDGQRSLSYRQLYNYLCHGQQYLKKQNIGEGKRYILKENNQMDFILTFLILLSVEAWVIPVSKDIKNRELDEIQQDTNALLFSDEFHSYKFDVNEQCNISLQIPQEDKTGILHMTSGTTEKSKYCIRTLAGLTLEGYSYKETFSILPSENLMSTCPLYHSFALGGAMMASIMSGACLYTINKFNPREIVKCIYGRKINYLVMVPDIAWMLCIAKERFELREHPEIRVALVGAGPITVELYQTFYERFGGFLLSNYGSTETGGLLTRIDPAPYASVGRPMYGVEVRLKDNQDRFAAEINEGELWVKSKAMLVGYLKETLTLDADGFFPMGDIVYRDKLDYYFIKGRICSYIKIGGNLFNPKKVEHTLLQYPGIIDCVIFGIAKSNGEQAVKAIVVGNNIDIQKLREYCQETMPGYMIPTIITIRESIPRNQMGKVRKSDLI